MTNDSIHISKHKKVQSLDLIRNDHFQNVTTFGHAVPALIHVRTKKEIVTAMLIASMI